MKYFAYGSNMSLKRLKERVPEATPLGVFTLKSHELRFHKSGRDNSGKCDAYFTGNPSNIVIGVLYDIDESGKTILDRIEGLGHGYNDKIVSVSNSAGETQSAITYYATNNDESTLPFTWYKEHVLIGARAAQLPKEYIEKIEAIEAVKDDDQQREAEQLDIYN